MHQREQSKRLRPLATASLSDPDIQFAPWLLEVMLWLGRPLIKIGIIGVDLGPGGHYSMLRIVEPIDDFIRGNAANLSLKARVEVYRPIQKR